MIKTWSELQYCIDTEELRRELSLSETSGSARGRRSFQAQAWAAGRSEVDLIDAGVHHRQMLQR